MSLDVQYGIRIFKKKNYATNYVNKVLASLSFFQISVNMNL